MKLQQIYRNEKNLKDVVREQVLKEKITLQNCNDESLLPAEILSLQLEFKGILNIDVLHDCTSLEKLELSNNLIHQIQGLDRLNNLTWLDLSFNRIENIEGLGSLRKLEMLNLSYNKISRIENMDTLENLTHIFIASNLIRELDAVLYLRRFKRLFHLNMTGNPVSENKDYTNFIAAFLPNLSFLDDILLNTNMKEEAKIKHQSDLQILNLRESKAQRAEEALQSQKAEQKLHKDSFVDDLDGASLFKNVFKDGHEVISHSLPRVAALLQTYEEKVVEQCRLLFDTGLNKHKLRNEELSCFFKGQNKVERYYQQEASQMLTEFDERHLERITKIETLKEPDLIKVEISNGNEEITHLCKGLVNLEFELVSNLKDNIKRLDLNISDMVGNFQDTVHGIFDQLRDQEEIYNEKVREFAIGTQENMVRENFEKETPANEKMLTRDKDLMSDTLDTNHNDRLHKITDRENQMLTRVGAWKAALFEEIREKEVQRNHTRILDIQRYADYLRKQLEDCNRTVT